MADPLSITTGVVGLLATCVQVGAAIKDFHDGAALADVKVKGLLSDVENFSQVLSIMKATLEEDQVYASLQATGHIGNHWGNLSRSIKDGQNTLDKLQSTLEKVNKGVNVLNGARKPLRFKWASEEIEIFQQQVRAYRDTIQLSLQTVILWNQATFKESTDTILVNLNEVYESIRRAAFDINTHISTLQTVVENCIRSAATIVLPVSTTLNAEYADPLSGGTYGSEFGDCFPTEPSETMLRWGSSNTIYKFEEDHSQSSISQGKTAVQGESLRHSGDIGESDHADSDSDTELEVEIFYALLQQGKKRLDAEDFRGAERLLRNCLKRVKSNDSLSTHHRNMISEIMIELIKTYAKQQKWNEAHSVLAEKIAIGSRYSKGDKDNALEDMLILAEILHKKEAYAEALLYGRRAFKGYRRMGSSGNSGLIKALQLLIDICHSEGNIDDEEAYTAVLCNFTKQELKMDSETGISLEKISSSLNNTHLDNSLTTSTRPHYQFYNATTGIGLALPIGNNLEHITATQIKGWFTDKSRVNPQNDQPVETPAISPGRN
ncbi:hypothetical protein B7463_g9089, partial [Scytalidium lignicola]